MTEYIIAPHKWPPTDHRNFTASIYRDHIFKSGSIIKTGDSNLSGANLFWLLDYIVNSGTYSEKGAIVKPLYDNSPQQ